MSGGLPSGAVGTSVVVLLYSFLCLFSGLLLFYLGWRHGSSTSYVSMIAVLASLACIASITQQIHFAADWVAVKAAQDAAKERNRRSPIFVVTSAMQGMDLGLFWIQFATYNINSLLVVFWAASLFQGTWRLVFPDKIQSLFTHLEAATKIFAVFFPAILLGIAHAEGISIHYLPYILLCNLCMGISLLIGSILLALTLYKFITLKRKLTSIGGSSGNSKQENSRMRRRDKWIIIRFSIAFTILSAFQVVVISFQALKYRNSQSTLPLHLTTPSELFAIRYEIALFMPGVSPPLVAFLVWGTTATYWQEIRRLFSCSMGRMGKSPLSVKSRMGANNFGILSNKGEQGKFSSTELRDMRSSGPSSSDERSYVAL